MAARRAHKLHGAGGLPLLVIGLGELIGAERSSCCRRESAAGCLSSASRSACVRPAVVGSHHRPGVDMSWAAWLRPC